MSSVRRGGVVRFTAMGLDSVRMTSEESFRVRDMVICSM